MMRVASAAFSPAAFAKALLAAVSGLKPNDAGRTSNTDRLAWQQKDGGWPNKGWASC